MFLVLFLIGSLVLRCNGADLNASCIKRERDALLKFKQGLTDFSNRLLSWEGEDCCSWEGVGCSNTTGHVIKLDLHNPSSWAMYYTPQREFCDSSCLGGDINPSLVNLTHLEYFDASMNNFSYAEIPSFLGSLKNLKYLDLGFAEFAGKVPHQLSNLSNLQHLDIRWNHLTIDNPGFVPSLSRLKHLDLSGLDASNASDWFHSINMIPSLVVLRLSNCGLSHIPLILDVNFTSLTFLVLSDNNFSSTIPRWLFNISSIRYFDLSSSAFQGSIPAEIGNSNLLTMLDLSENELEGALPASIGKLSNLTELYITHSNLRGNIPESIGQLSNLEMLDLHDNFLDGMVSERHLSNLTSLTHLFLAQNQLVFNISPIWVPPFQLGWISITSCKIGPNFPQWLKTQTNLFKIDMSNASISDSIPDWFDNISLSIEDLDLSYNHITKNLPKFRKLSAHLYREIYLDSNKFEGPLDPFPSDVAILDVSNNFLSGHIPQTLTDNGMPHMRLLFLSNNQFSGGIPVYLCKMQDLNFLGLANNQLSGGVPECWQKRQGLLVMDLANNNLSGPIPVSMGSLQRLVSLHLENNNLQGEIPVSLKNLANLRALDLSGNSFSSTIPAWIGENLSSLKMFNLHSNMIHGEIPQQLCNLVSLRLLDLGRNTMTGAIPHCFGNFTAMIFNGTRSEKTWSRYPYPYLNYPHLAYDDHTLAFIKGTELEYTKTLQFLFSIDLSGNNFTGTIPEELMSLSKLQNLNLSGNYLEGHIPSNIGNMKLLESLDLSRNVLSGSIPSSITDLNFLSHLNLSFNNLSGHIPSGNQIQTLDDKSIYIGNDGLCGFPLKKCTEEEPHKGFEKVEKTTKDETEKLWFFCGLGMGFTSGFVGVCSILYFKDSWRLAYFGFADKICNKLWVIIAIKANQLRRKLHWKRF
ncbi:hypothetical protein P3X46_026530 [Hevea brasiliensis]|uniref:Leucine-rich repeat-containing N-terminal plant-type domain-containing protein n=1 Tax=Hevea brasiliensis TaxID=3981 RepID=A0ABQ9KZ56_HEVBR|nr:receptor-like protein EIX2 [Hevea brasiliensis]KAJ9153041.1 hypothetical protein P3X46_026530 [Hevea brasiliensis]